jgi:hypothetical protein
MAVFVEGRKRVMVPRGVGKLSWETFMTNFTGLDKGSTAGCNHFNFFSTNPRPGNGCQIKLQTVLIKNCLYF